jgi:antitoxin ParD1/3/4
MTVKFSISLTDQQHAFAKALVDEGRYASLSAVIQQGLDMLHQREEREMADTRALIALLEERAKGPFISMEEFVKRTDVMLDDLAREYGVQD